MWKEVEKITDEGVQQHSLSPSRSAGLGRDEPPAVNRLAAPSESMKRVTVEVTGKGGKQREACSTYPRESSGLYCVQMKLMRLQLPKKWDLATEQSQRMLSSSSV